MKTSRRIIVAPSDTDFDINLDSIADGLTQSEMQTWDDCPEKWYLGYNLMLHKIGKFSWPLVYGHWIHGAWQEFYTTKGKRWSLDTTIRDRQFIAQENLIKEDYWRGVAEVQMSCYASHFKNDHKIIKAVGIEEIVDIWFEGFRLKGMIDLYSQDLTCKNPSYFVWDHKTTYMLNRAVVLGWDFRFQFLFYCWIATKVKKWKDMPCKGFMVNAMKKPQLKQGVHESLDAFLQRLQNDMMERPEAYYYREKLLLSKDTLKRFEDNILRPKLNRLKLMLDPKVDPLIKITVLRNKNTNHCVSKFGSQCEFLKACQNGLETEGFQYRKRDVKHQELETEDADE